jgi:hypothetical protein
MTVVSCEATSTVRRTLAAIPNMLERRLNFSIVHGSHLLALFQASNVQRKGDGCACCDDGDDDDGLGVRCCSPVLVLYYRLPSTVQ